MKAEGIGLYIHIPFCKKKCNYCDFCSYPNISESVRTSYIKRLCEEISEYKKEPKIKLETVFFGGGTPTLLTASELMEIWSAVLDTFDTGSVSEFTLEANPGTVTREILSAFSDIGANRISIGLQSIHENELKKLGRIHTCEDFLASFELAREYFDNVSLDVMYGIAEQSFESFKRTLDFVSSLPVTHLSVYGLIIEEGTPFYKERKALLLPSEDEECDMYLFAAEKLAEASFSHYEISNYAKRGYECRHNLKYWQCEEYIGVGVAAASYFGNIRYTNSRDINEYLHFDGAKYNREYETPHKSTEYIMLSLRTRRGIVKEEFAGQFGKDALMRISSLAEKFKSGGYAVENDEAIYLTERGFYISNYVISELI